MSLAAQLSTLESAGLISLARAHPDLEYFFRHALVQDAAYDSLLKADRRWLHRAAGEALEQLYSERLDELAPRLAEHFWQAGDASRALKYYQMAAGNAARTYANAEAIDLYSRALRAAGSDLKLQSEILRSRGSLLDTTGEFEKALADDEAALSAARAAGDLESEWKSLVALGFLWSSRDYQKTGDYYRQAEGLARRLGDPQELAHSLNWLGNYQINVGEPESSHMLHEEALQIFTEMHDEGGIAETADLLGMSLALGGNLFRAADTLNQALEVYRRLGDRRGASSVLASWAVLSGMPQTDTLVHPDITIADSVRGAEEALKLASEAGWRSGEVFALSILGFCLTSQGAYDQALSVTKRAVQLAFEIHHRQWEIIASLAAGDLYASVYQAEQAEEMFDRGHHLATESHSAHWIQVMTGRLAAALIQQGKLSEAESLLDQYSPLNLPSLTLGQRNAWCARADLALHQGNLQQALAIADQLCATAPNLQLGRVIIRVWSTRGEALTGLGKASADKVERGNWLREGEQVLSELLAETQRLGYHTRTWQAQRLLAGNLAAQGREEEAAACRKAARQKVLDLAHSITDGRLQSSYLDHALALVESA